MTVSSTVAIELNRLCLENLDSRLERDREIEWRNDRAFCINGKSEVFFRTRLSREVSWPHSPGLPYGNCPWVPSTFPSSCESSVKVLPVKVWMLWAYWPCLRPTSLSVWRSLRTLTQTTIPTTEKTTKMAAPEAAIATTLLNSSISTSQPIALIRARLAKSRIQALIRMQISKWFARVFLQASYIVNTVVESGESNRTTQQTEAKQSHENREGIVRVAFW
jgi:hypothetical protein